MPELTLYRANGSCALVPHAVLLHLGIPVKSVVMRIGPEGYAAADGSLSPAEYRTIHPLGYVPALVVDGEVLTEVPALLNYISSLAPEKNLMASEGMDRARVAEWLNILSGTLHGSGFAMFWRPMRFTDDKAAYDSITAKGRAVILQTYQRIEAALKDRAFAVGDSLTVVDFYLYVFARWGGHLEIDMKEAYPNYGSFARRMETVDGIKKAVEIEGVGFRF